MKLLRLLLAGLLAAATPHVAGAATYDPTLTWRTLVTEHFRIHFHQGEEQLAEEFSQLVEAKLAEMQDEFRWRMRIKTDIVLVDNTDRANGFAQVVPYNAITIFVTAPQEDSTLSLYEDWSTLIFTHELSHVLHLETNEGLVTAVRAVVGRIASTNDVSPPWIVEGLATFQETRHSATGRGRAPYVDMIKRTAALQDGWPPLGNMDGIQAALPSGNLRYLFGQDFIQWVADHKGEDVWTRWTHTYGRSVPWALFLLPPRRVFGDRFQAMYADWRDERLADYAAQADAIRAEGVREGQLVSEDTSSCTAPSFAPDDSVMVWSCYDLSTGSALWIAEADGSGPQILRQDMGAKSFTWRADSKAFVYAATHLVNRFNTWSDIYLFDLPSHSVRAMTRGARARDPDFSPDGSHLVMVTNKAQDTQLEVMTVDQRRTALTADTDHTQYATPRYAPNGEVMAVSIWDEGRRDLWLVDTAGTRLRRLTFDTANDRDPFWSSDGRWLYFSSDRSGVPNIFALDTTTEHLWQVTNVLTGAARPTVSHDGTRLAYEQYSQDGFEVRLMPLDPAQFLDRGVLPSPVTGGPSVAALVHGEPPPIDDAAVAAWQGEPVDLRGPGSLPAGVALDPHQDGPSIDTYEQAKVDDAFGEEQDYPFTITPRRYNPLPAMAPRYWLPILGTTPRLPNPPSTPVTDAFSHLPVWIPIGGLRVGATTGTSDPLRQYGYGLGAWWRSDSNQGGGSASVTINRWLPVFGASFFTDAAPYTYRSLGPWQPGSADVDPTLYTTRTLFMRSYTGALSFAYPFSIRSTFFASYAFTDRRLIADLDPYADLDTVALRGTIGDLTVGYGYAWGQPTATAVSPEDGRSITLTARLTAPWLGTFAVDEDGTRTGVTQVLVSADWREYIVNPAAPNHVFALRGGLGVAFGGQQRFLGNFQLGGNGLGSARTLRGYPFGADRGDSYWLLGAEYRFPIWRMDRGFGTVPLFFRYLAGTVFAEAGNAFSAPESLLDVFDDTLVGVGAELRLSTFILWQGTLELRVGYAVGLTQNGYWFDNPNTAYVLLSTNL